MLDVTTTITVNGHEGQRFLSSLGTYRAPVPRALRFLAASSRDSIEVGAHDAELIARFVAELLASGWIDVAAPPLLFSPRLGDPVALGRDVLAEVVGAAASAPRTWCFLPAGARGTLVGWRERVDGAARAVIELGRAPRRVVVLVGAAHVTRAPERHARVGR